MSRRMHYGLRHMAIGLLALLVGACSSQDAAQPTRQGPFSDSAPTAIHDGGMDARLRKLRSRILDDARDTLELLNRDYLAGRLHSNRMSCVNESFPVTHFHCDDNSGQSMRNGVVWTLAYHPTEQCRAGLLHTGDGSSCSAQYVELGYAGRWNVMYRSRSRGGAAVEALQLGQQLDTGAGIDGIAGYCEITISAQGDMELQRTDLCSDAADSILGDLQD